MAYKYKHQVITYYREWRKKNRNKLNRKARARYHKDPEKEMRRHAKWVEANRDRLNAYCRANRLKHKEKINRSAKAYRAKAKDEVFRHYGGYKCACCGESNRKFLTMDHMVKGTHGKYERKQLCIWIKQHNFPPHFQVLCYNCNLGRDKNNGVCPHKDRL